MAYNNKYKSIKSVIEDAFRDSGVENIDYETAIADTLEIIGLIGVPHTFISKSTNGIDSPVVEVINYRAELPYDLYSLKAIRKVGIDTNSQVLTSEEMIEVTDLFHQTHLNSINSEINYTAPVSNTIIAELDDDDVLSVEDAYIVGPKIILSKEGPYKYKIQNSIIFTDFKDGYIDIAYNAYPTDESGMIMIPDDDKLSNAVKWNIIYKHDLRKWRAFPEKPGLKALLNESSKERDFYTASARNKAHIPTIDKMEAIKNQWLRSNNDINAHANGFKTLNNIQRRKF